MTPAGSTPPNLFRRIANAFLGLPLGVRTALVATLVLHGFALGWGMPASDAWDNDGIAPRDFLPGLAETFTPGHYFTYPPLHLALLTILTLPITLLAAWNAKSTQVPVVLREIIQPPYMTAMAMTARVVSLAMSAGIVLCLAKIAEELAGGPASIHPKRRDRVASLTAWMVTLGAPFTYYGHTTNLDVPYLFWGSLAALALVRAIVRHEPRRLRAFALFAACGVATKDQAYALFLASAPCALLLWLGADPWPRLQFRTVLRDLVVGALLALALLLLLDGALFNPSGFRARLAFLSGSASQDFAQYARGWAGRRMILLDGAENFTLHYPSIFALFMGIGIVHALVSARAFGRSTLAAAFVPLLVIVSFTVCFNFVARRVEERFTLPQMLFLAIYGGFGLELVWSGPASAWFERYKPVLWILRAGCIFVLALGVYRSASIDAMLVREPRYQTEAFLERNVTPGDTLEVHGLNTYLPRLPTKANVTRIGPTDPERRGPIPGVEERKDAYMNVVTRRPKWIVANMCFTWRYLERYDAAFTSTEGRVLPKIQEDDTENGDATTFFRGLFRGTMGYHLVDHAFVHEGGFFPIVNLHASLNCSSFVFLRDGERLPSDPLPR